MKPWSHALISAKKFGGIPADYIDIHTWFDHTKAHVADVRHRMVLHNSFGIFLAEQVFGTIIQMKDGSFKKLPYIMNSDGNQVQVRDIGEQHVLDDLGTIPSLDKCLSSMVIEEFMGGPIRKRKVFRMAKDSVELTIVAPEVPAPEEQKESETLEESSKPCLNDKSTTRRYFD